jgi:probable aminopeptidase NPEPL1
MAIARAEAGVKWKKVKGGDDGDENKEKKESVEVRFFLPSGAQVIEPSILTRVEDAVSAVHMASRIVDTPPNFMTPDDVVKEAEDMRERLGGESVISYEVLRGEELRDKGYGGIWNVGKAAPRPPALIVMTKKLKSGSGGKKISLVGKGITYDTGGLSLKVGGSMVGMKGDLGGAAGVIGAFEYICKSSSHVDDTWGEVELILCVAENSIGKEAFRNDDVITLLSGRTCEINNTDAEGRLVLADGVARACEGGADVILDMATLTGAQLVSTGKKHAMIVCNDEDWEGRCVDAGKRTGDLCHPGLFVPEMFEMEFKSSVADSKNSVKDRMNAQSSCAAHFVFSNLDKEWVEKGGKWIHVDMAGPSVEAERGTGYGVGLVGALMGAI